MNIYRYEYHFVRNLYLYLHKCLRGKVRKISALKKKVDNFTILLSFSTTFSSDSYTLFQSEGKQRSPAPTKEICSMYMASSPKCKVVLSQNFLSTIINTLEKAMATHSSTLAWRIPWTEEPGRLQSMGSLRVGHDWATSLSLFTFMHWKRKWQPTPVFLPGESQGPWDLMGCHLWGSTESDTTEAT